jgi:hypothetical protein
MCNVTTYQRTVNPRGLIIQLTALRALMYRHTPSEILKKYEFCVVDVEEDDPLRIM